MSHGLSVAQDDDVLALLQKVEELGELCLGLVNANSH